MNRIMLLIGSALIVSACSVQANFNATQQYRHVADCYAAFLALGLEAGNPALGYDLDRRELLTQTALDSLTRLKTYTAQSALKAGGEAAFLEMANTAEEKLALDKIDGEQAKRDAYMAIAAKADACHDDMTRWGAPPRTMSTTTSESAQTAPAQSPPPSPR